MKSEKVRGKLLFCDNTLWGLVNFRSYIFTHLLDAGFEVVLVAPQDEDTVMKIEVPTGVRYRSVWMNRCGKSPLEDFRYFLRLFRIYREERPCHIFHYTIKPNIYGTFAAKLLGIPCTCMIAGMGYALEKKGILNKLAYELYRIALRKADAVLCLNEDNRRFILEHGFCLPQRLTLLKGGEGVDLLRYSYAYEDSGETVFLMVGRVLVDKGYREFVQASAWLKSHGYGCFKCALLGPLDHSYPTHISREELDRDVADGWLEYWGVTDCVQDFLKRPGVVVVLPSFYHEGLNRSLMEACAMGKPIITTDIPGCRETVDEGMNGFLVPSKDAVSLARAMAAYLKMGVAEKRAFSLHSRKKAEETFDVRYVYETYLKLLCVREDADRGTNCKTF